MLAYYARPVCVFGTNNEQQNINNLEKLGFTVVDITSEDVQNQYQEHGMSVFMKLIEKVDVLFFEPFDDSYIGAGVAKEMEWARSFGVPIFEIPTSSSIESRTLTVEETRSYLKGLGVR